MRWFPDDKVPIVNGIAYYSNNLGNALGLVLPTFLITSAKQVHYLNLFLLVSALFPLIGAAAVQERPKRERNTHHTENTLPLWASLRYIFTHKDYLLCLLQLNVQIGYVWSVISLVDYLNTLQAVSPLEKLSFSLE